MFGLEVAKQYDAVVELLDNGRELKAEFPTSILRNACVIEQGGAWYVNPWALVKAYLGFVGKHGAHIVPKFSNGDWSHTDGGMVISASKVFHCINSYMNMLLLGPMEGVGFTYMYWQCYACRNWREKGGEVDKDAIHHWVLVKSPCLPKI